MANADEPTRTGRTTPSGSLFVWATRAVWLVVAVVGGAAIGDALAGRSRAVQATGTVGAWVGWGAAAVALAMTGVVTLTVVRVLVPGALVVSVATALAGAPATSVIALAAPAIVAVALVCSAEFGRCYMQASAYGDELRFGLRPPLGYLSASIVTWLLAATAATIAPLAWAARAWVVATVATAVLAASAWLLPRRWHQLARRWFVLVPAGAVVHDPVVLADTLMLPPRKRGVDRPGSRRCSPTPGRRPLRADAGHRGRTSPRRGDNGCTRGHAT